MYRKKVLAVFGTRPEAIKMAPVVMELKKHPDRFETFVCLTAQHREMLDSVMDLFNIKADFDLDIMKENQNLWDITTAVLLETKKIYDEIKPDIVLVHGDTTTTMAAALSAFYAKIPIAHVEAGLRTFDKAYPFPEEINRVFTDELADIFFAPTQKAADNLKNKKNIFITGNTIIDALLHVSKNYNKEFDFLDKNLKTILLTSHRRENFGEPLQDICRAIKHLIEKNKDIQVVFPVHYNPNVRKVVFGQLDGIERIKLIEPLDYAPFTALMRQSYLILSDSGGVQEEAPSLQKPVLVLRDTTERAEAVESGAVRLIGTKKEAVIKETQLLLDDRAEYKKMISNQNPYGDGLASKRIVKLLLSLLS